MNKQEKLIALIIGLALAGWMWHSVSQQKKAAETAAQYAATTQTAPAAPAAPANPAPAATTPAPTPAAPAPAAPQTPEKLVTLADSQVELTLSSHGAVVKSAKLLEYAEKSGAISDDNPAITLNFAAAPLLALDGIAGGAVSDDFALVAASSNSATFANAALKRTITLRPGFRIEVEEKFAAPAKTANRVSLGCIGMGNSQNDILSIDSMLPGEKPKILHHSETEPLKSYLVGGSGGCGGKKSAAGIPETSSVDVAGQQTWIAVKNRFFVSALANSSEPNTGFRATMTRDIARQEYALKSVSAAAAFAEIPASRSYTVFVGPKKQSLLWDLGMKDVMEFGMWRWICYPIVWLLNFFHNLIPNYGVGVILLTILVRILFWPLTHKSTVSMRKMQEIQPKIKEIQARCKDNPQKLQQETWQCYRENKVNPMSSCLPMLAQIPVFIALFTVLRSAVELRYAPFLWIADLSEPEALFASWFPFGGLNILPILMAATMALQSALTPSSGDKNQQRMMMVMMPVMMLVMFYNFPSALSLYWTLSQIVSIVQMWWIRKKYTPAPAAAGVTYPDAVEMPVTRQMRRHP